jgi:hypothetical protein
MIVVGNGLCIVFFLALFSFRMQSKEKNGLIARELTLVGKK